MTKREAQVANKGADYEKCNEKSKEYHWSDNGIPESTRRAKLVSYNESSFAAGASISPDGCQFEFIGARARRRGRSGSRVRHRWQSRDDRLPRRRWVRWSYCCCDSSG